MVFNGRGDNMPASQVPDCSGERGIGAFRAAGGEEDLSRMSVQHFRNGFTGIFDPQPRFPSIGIDGRRVAEFLGEVGQHGIQHFLIQRSGGRVIKINPLHGVLLKFAGDRITRAAISELRTGKFRKNPGNPK